MEVLNSNPHKGMEFVDLSAGVSGRLGFVCLSHEMASSGGENFYLLTPNQARDLATELLDSADEVDPAGATPNGR